MLELLNFSTAVDTFVYTSSLIRSDTSSTTSHGMTVTSVLYPSQLPAPAGVSGAAVGGAIAALLILAVFAAAGVTILIVVLVRRRSVHKSTTLITDQNSPQFENPMYQGKQLCVVIQFFNLSTGTDFPITAKAQDLEESCYLTVPDTLYETTGSNIYDDCGDLVIVSTAYNQLISNILL